MTVSAPPPTKHMVIGTMAEIIATVDHHARALNRRWGFNRLPHIVPIEHTERFIRQKHKWELACFECTGDPRPEALDRVRRHGEAMLRAYDALEQLAQAAGHSPVPPDAWEFELRDGMPIRLVRDRAEMGQVDHPPGGQVWALEEIATIIARFPELVLTKHEFPQAEIVQMRTSAKTRALVDDSLADIPGF